MEKYFTATKLNQLKKSISNIEQQAGETLCDYYERFKRLHSSCPYHGYSDQDLILYFYNGLLDDERRMVNAACRGNILNKTPTVAYSMMSELSEWSRQFRKPSTSGVNSANSLTHASKSDVAELKEMMQRFMLKGTP